MTILADDDSRSCGVESTVVSEGSPSRSLGRRSAAERRKPAPEDPELIAIVCRARAGDLAAQADLVRRYRIRVAGLIRPMVKQPAAVEDLVQTVLIKMVRQLGGLREPARFETWLFTLARNVVLDHLRRMRCRPVTTVDEVVWRSVPDPSTGERCHEIMEALEVAMRGCGARDRRMLMQVLTGASYRAIASSEGMSIGALKVRLHRLRVLLRMKVRLAVGDLEQNMGPESLPLARAS